MSLDIFVFITFFALCFIIVLAAIEFTMDFIAHMIKLFGGKHK